MRIIKKEVLSFEEKETLCKLWNNEYPEQLNYTIAEFDSYLNGLSKTIHFLLIDDTNIIHGWAFTFLRDDEDWFAIIIDNQMQGKRKGLLFLNEIKKEKSNLNGWVVDHENDSKQNGERYKSPLQFYLKNGFTICKGIRIENEKISAVKINWKA
jgi:hypothetical protein